MTIGVLRHLPIASLALTAPLASPASNSPFFRVNSAREFGFSRIEWPTKPVRKSRSSFAVAATMSTGQANTSNDAQQETMAFWERIQAHQKAAAKLPAVEEARTLLERCPRAMLSTTSKKYGGYPFGSMVGFAADDKGRPVLAISTLSPHTADLQSNSKCSLLVSTDPNEQSEPLVTLVGNAIWVPEAEADAARQVYLNKHPDAFWVDFGDFSFVRIEPLIVRYTANIATFSIGASVSEFSPEEFAAASPDPIAAFEKPVASHMNADHESSTIAMVQHALQVKVPSAKIINMDRLGLRVEVPLEGQVSRIRLPFPRPAEDRKDLKTLIVEMTNAAVPKA